MAPEEELEASKLRMLANWMTDIEHGAGALLARVIVNRLWHHHFGRGIVSTPNDFGRLGTEPTHPALLDWLASKLIQEGWRLKPIHRLIMNSSVYKQAASTKSAQARHDAYNEYLWHRRPLRMEAEVIRDHMLSVSGALRPDMYGPSTPIGSRKNLSRTHRTPGAGPSTSCRRASTSIRSSRSSTFRTTRKASAFVTSARHRAARRSC